MVKSMMASLDDYVSVLRGIRQKVWLQKNKYPVLYGIWAELGLISHSGNGVLTGKGQEIVRLQPLLEYEFSVGMDQVINEEPETSQMNYRLLRTGLARYFELYIQEYFVTFFEENRKLGHSAELPGQVLDLGCGSGAYSIALKNKLDNLSFTLMDRSTDHLHLPFTSIVGDITRPNPKLFARRYDYIMLNEVVHCLSKEEITNLLANIDLCLTAKGKIFITEQFVTRRIENRMATYSKGGKNYTFAAINMFLSNRGFINTEFVENETQSHYTAVYQRKI